MQAKHPYVHAHTHIHVHHGIQCLGKSKEGTDSLKLSLEIIVNPYAGAGNQTLIV